MLKLSSFEPLKENFLFNKWLKKFEITSKFEVFREILYLNFA